MDYGFIYLFALAFAAIISVAMWLDYFRQIDVFEQEKIAPLFLAMFIGGLSPYLSLFIYGIFDRLGFEENGSFFNDALFAVFGIGLNEELCKLAAVIVVFKILKKQINEPIDVLIYAGVTALGFSLVENYNYFYNYGIKIITSRTFYSALEHIINTSIIVYGYFRLKLFNKGNQFLNTVTGITLAVASHGMFDFFLSATFLGSFTPFLSLLIYLVGINFWIQMLNNANNYSSYFDYSKTNYSPKLVYRLMYWYGLTLIIAFVNNAVIASVKFSVITLFYGLLSDGFLFWIVILRVSRFKIYKMKYFTVSPVLPFYVTRNNDEDFRIPFLNLPIKIRGENFQEHLLTKYLHQEVQLAPVNANRSFIKQTLSAFIEEKYLLHDDVIVYAVSLRNIETDPNTMYLLKPKMTGIKQRGFQYPIQGLYSVKVHPDQLIDIDPKKLKFIEWVYLKSRG